jgi:nitrogen fixation/metabolism regulation signal transduction histidine kinase
LQSGGPSPSAIARIEAAEPRGGEHWLLVSVRDTGTGFNNETVGRALDPFYTKRNTGVGLGLTVAKKIINDHGGLLEVRLRSEPGDADVVMRFPQDF